MEALKGVRILDMTHVQAGPTCSQLLAWMGADVIKFEPPQGDATRGQLRDVPNADSLYFTMLNCNKRSITVNMKSAETIPRARCRPVPESPIWAPVTSGGPSSKPVVEADPPLHWAMYS